jgi:hypothetical protein
VFGLRPSPAILGATINHHLDTLQENNPEMVEHLRESLYVDDLVSGAQNDEKAFQIYKQSKEIMSTGGFNLRKWHSNSRSLMNSINALEDKVVSSSPDNQPGVIEEDLSYAKESIAQESAPANKTQIKVLGKIWDTDTDMLLFNFEELIEYAKSLPMTKRSFLKWSSKIFNPLGFLMPFTIKLKMLFQELCLGKTSWDEKVDEKTCATINNLRSELAFLNEVPIPRCYFLPNLKPAVVQIHGFSDASERAFAAVIYLRTLYENGTIDVNLIASKGTILARLESNISKALSLNVQEFYWVDSTATLCWIRNERLWKQYIQNRETEIRKIIPEMWHFCPGTLNPADLPSPGISAKALCQERLWLKGPDILFQSEDQWPTNPEKGMIDNDDNVLCEAVKGPTDVVRSLPANTSEEPKVISTNISEVIDIDPFGNLKKLLRVTAYVLRFVNTLKKAKQHDKGSRDLKFLSASEIEQAEIMWLCSVQELSFAKESEFLQWNVQKSPPQYVTQFGLYTDESHVIRCKG